MLVDSHCHLDYPELAADPAAVLARAQAAGVGAALTIGTRLDRFERVRALAERFETVWCTVGVHPHEAAAAENGPVTVARLIALADHPRVVGFGETGLDFYYEHSPRDAQAACFRLHVAAARACGLPVVVHTRDADPETIEILADETRKGPFPGLIHCFSTGRELAEKAIEIGFYISISGIVTFKNARLLQEIVRDLPLDRLLVETDAPFLAPVPMRGKPNEPAYVVHVADKIAELKGIERARLAEATTANFFRLFGKARPVPAGAPGRA